MIATNIPLFQGINQLPIILDPIMLDEGLSLTRLFSVASSCRFRCGYLTGPAFNKTAGKYK
jgi:hypothetical protein